MRAAAEPFPTPGAAQQPRRGIPNVLSVAGTDPSGGAGIQADLKAFSALGAYGTTVVTALVAQTTTGVARVQEVPADFVTAQLETLLDDVRIDAVKIGMLADAEVVEAVAAVLERYRPPYVVLDPVMVAKSGDRLLAASAASAVRDRLLPLVDLVTPNLPEAADLLDEEEAADLDGMRAQAARLRAAGARRVLLKGGHLPGGDSADVLLGDGIPDAASGPRCGSSGQVLTASRVPTRNTHGTGCTLSSAIAALRPRTAGWPQAVRDAKTYLTGALRAADALDVGRGHGPVHHFHALWPEPASAPTAAVDAV